MKDPAKKAEMVKMIEQLVASLETSVKKDAAAPPPVPSLTILPFVCVCVLNLLCIC